MASTWKPAKTWRPPPKCADPRDNVPPHHDPPAKRDYAELWLRICRERLHHRHDKESAA